METEILIKGMVCERCISILRDGLSRLGYAVRGISLGRIVFAEPPSPSAKSGIERFIRENGFELVSSRQVRIVNDVKELIEEVFGPNTKQDARIRFSNWIADRLHLNYDSISHAFGAVEGITLEKYIISRRLDKVKELLVYTPLSLTDIAYTTGFSSINHLSRQFKDLTGFTPSSFRASMIKSKRVTNKKM